MHDAAHGYSPDAYVVDADDRSPTRSRTATEELTVHVQVIGTWHRRTPDIASTACGIQYHGQFGALRREELVGRLCGDCFTPFEMTRAAAANRDLEKNT